MKTNAELQLDVQNAIMWEPLLNATEIGVIAKEGVISLTGEVDSYAKKIEVENAAKKVVGVKVIVEKIEVKLPCSLIKSDAEIATEILNTLKSNWSVPEEKVSIKVEDGWVTLEGELGWNYQKDAAKRAITYLTGVKGLINNIKIKSESVDIIEQKDIEKALARSWSVDDKDIHVNVAGTTVKLTGSVGSFHQKEEAGRIAWDTAGIWHLENELAIDYYHVLVD